jgi:large subunit ribosomal protein L13
MAKTPLTHLTKKDLNQTIYVHPKHVEATRKRYVVDAAGMTLGRLGVEIAKKLQGKHNPAFASFRDTGDFVVVLNAHKIVTTGYKLNSKMYYRYSGWKGNLKSKTLQEMLDGKNPTDVLMYAVRGMLPKNKLRAPRMKRLKLMKGATHPYTNLDLIPLLND